MSLFNYTSLILYMHNDKYIQGVYLTSQLCIKEIRQRLNFRGIKKKKLAESDWRKVQKSVFGNSKNTYPVLLFQLQFLLQKRRRRRY
jgi:hypothetical protein